MGDNTSPRLTGQEIDDLIKSGLSEADIARRYKMSKNAVNHARYYEQGVPRRDPYMTAKERAKALFPWKRVGMKVSGSYPWKMLKAHSTWRIRHDENDLSEDQLRKLVLFYRRMITENLIVEYTPHEGLNLKARRPEERRLMIRPNEWTNLDDPSRRLHWSYPRIMPKGGQDLVSLLSDEKD